MVLTGVPFPVMRAFITFCCLLAIPALAQVSQFDMRDGAQRNVVHFVSDAALEKVVGVSTALWGDISLDVGNLSRGIRGELAMDVRTFETGIEARNHSLRDFFFLGTIHPIAKFIPVKIGGLSSTTLKKQTPVTGWMEGDFHFRGIVRRQRVKMSLVYWTQSEETKQRLPGNLLRFRAQMELKLEDYGIDIPKIWSKRFSPTIQIEMDAFGTDKSPALAFDVPDGPKPKERTK